MRCNRASTTLISEDGLIEADPALLRNAYAHNDNEQIRPLWKALHCGFLSIEVDICLVGEQLLVGHDSKSTKAERTLQALYLEPLRGRIAQNGGSVHRQPARFTLIIDVKTEAEKTYDGRWAVAHKRERSVRF